MPAEPSAAIAEPRAAAIEIRGAGPVGATAALLLDALGIRPRLVDPRPAPRPGFRPGFRPIALSYASRLILERAGAWPALAPTPILAIHVSQQGRFGRTRLEAADAGVPALGYVIELEALGRALSAALGARGIALQAEPAGAALVVHAEGTTGDLEAKSYGQTALVARVAATPPAAGTAWERFTPDGPLALLPMGARYCAVWGMRPERAAALAAAPEAEFLAALGRTLGSRAGEFAAVEARGCVPLELRVRPSRIGLRAAYIGNAAQTLHPVAGQGLNLGLRDAWDLAQVLHDAEDPGEARVLGRYAALRRVDAAATVRVTDRLAAGFLGDDPFAGLMRGIALTALDICPPARRFFARRMIYGVSAMP